MRRVSLDALIYALCAYGLPLAIAALAWIALAAWQPHYRVAGAAPLELRVLEERDAPLDPPQALEELRSRAAIAHQDTQLSETPFWFNFAVRPAAGARAVELPSRHAMTAECWQGEPLAPQPVSRPLRAVAEA